MRSTKAQAKTGTLKGSISQSLFDADNKLDTAEAEALEKAFKEEIPSKITEDKPIYIICNSGARGAQKATFLENLAITQALRKMEKYTLSQTVQKAWNSCTQCQEQMEML